MSEPHDQDTLFLLSRRPTKRLTALYAIVIVDADGSEGIVRRETPSGTMPWITDDVTLLPTMLKLAREPFPDAHLKTVTFRRAEP